MNKDDKLPKYVFLIIAVVVTFLLVDGLKYFWDDYQNEPVSHPTTIGKYNNLKMDEKIDNNNDKGILSNQTT